MNLVFRLGIALTLWVVTFVVCVSAQDAATKNKSKSPTDFDRLIVQLGDDQPISVRIKAAKILGVHGKDKNSLRAIPALKKGLQSKNDQLRYQFLVSYTIILSNETRECPIELMEFADDKSEKIREIFLTLIGFFDKFPYEALPRIPGKISST